MESNSLLIGTLKHQEMSCHIFIFFNPKIQPVLQVDEVNFMNKIMQFTGMLVEDTDEKEQENDQGNEEKKKFYNNIITMRCCHPQHAREMETFHQNHH